MQRIRLCVVTPEFLPIWGGAGTYIVELAKHLPRNVEIHVVTPLREGFGRDRQSSPNMSKIQEHFGDNVHVHFVCRATDTFLYNASFQLACLKHVPRIINEEDIDIVHVCHHMAALLLELKRDNFPTVTTIHNTIQDQRRGTRLSGTTFSDMDFSEKATNLSYPMLRLAEILYFSIPRYYITVSNWMKTKLKRIHVAGSIRVIPNSVDVSRYEAGKTDEILHNRVFREAGNRRIVLFVGRLLAMKGVHVLADAIPEILREVERNDVLFVFVGPGDKSSLLNRLRKSGVESNCLFTGPIPKETVYQLMSRAELVTVPSFYENVPFVIMESMACGTPVLASNVGGIPEIVQDNYDGLLVKPGSTKALADAATQLLRDKSLRDRLGYRARDTIIRKFSWEVNLPKYLHTYLTIAGLN